MLNHRGKGWIAAFALVAAALVLAPAALADGLSVELAPVSNRAVLGPNDGVPLRFTVINDTDVTLGALYWHMPFRGFETDMFVVELNGRRVAYTDRMVLRLAPEPGDWMPIGPGESVSTVIDLARSYDMSEPGTYTVQFDFPIEVRGSETPGPQAPARVRSDVLLVSTVGAQKGQYEKGGPPVSAGCTTEQFDILDARQAAGDVFAANAGDHMDGAPTNDPLYIKWFGAYDATRWNTVNGNFEKIDATMDEQYNYTCISCGRTMVAYVYKDRPYEVWICPTFFNTDLLNENFQAGVLLHETSHWYPPYGAGTNDYAYGESPCLSLAISNPTYAIANADSYHLFSRDVSNALP